MKGGLEMEPEKLNVAKFHEYTALCGWALALAHARSGHPGIISGYLGKSEAFDDAIWSFSQAYAQQNEKDFGTFCKRSNRASCRWPNEVPDPNSGNHVQHSCRVDRSLARLSAKVAF